MILASNTLLSTATLLVLSAVITNTEAFGLLNTPIKPVLTVSPSFAVIRPTRYSSALCAEGGEEAEEKKEETATDDDTNEDSSKTDEEEEAPAVAKEDEVDPEVKALKDEISQLESDLKQKNRDLSKLEDLADNYSEGGYARKVAEMEGYRRTRSVSDECVRVFIGVMLPDISPERNYPIKLFIFHLFIFSKGVIQRQWNGS